MLNFWTLEKNEQRPWYGNLLWGLLYFCFCWLFFAASSPFVGARKRRRKWTLYGVGYNTLLLWVSAGLLGHSPFFLQMVEFDIDEPVSLLFPLFWAGLGVLLSVDASYTTGHNVFYSTMQELAQLLLLMLTMPYEPNFTFRL